MIQSPSIRMRLNETIPMVAEPEVARHHRQRIQTLFVPQFQEQGVERAER